MFSTTFIQGGQGLILKGTNEVTWSQMYDAKKALAQDGCCSVSFAMIDLEEVTQLHMTHEQMREMIHIDRVLAKKNPRAVVAVAAPKDHVFGLARMWQSLVDEFGWKTAVFRSREEAVRWGTSMTADHGLEGGTPHSTCRRVLDV